MTTPSAFEAIRTGDVDALSAALDAGTDPDAVDGDGYSLLIKALVHVTTPNRSRMVEVILNRGANVHQQSILGMTPLHYAASWMCNVDVFYTIFSATGSRAMNLGSAWHGMTPLHYLVRDGTVEQVAFALSHPGIDISVVNHEGLAPSKLLRLRLSDGGAAIAAAIENYGNQEARWQIMRFTWIKLLQNRRSC
jgi:ankyrin repeat protein